MESVLYFTRELAIGSRELRFAFGISPFRTLQPPGLSFARRRPPLEGGIGSDFDLRHPLWKGELALVSICAIHFGRGNLAQAAPELLHFFISVLHLVGVADRGLLRA